MSSSRTTSAGKRGGHAVDGSHAGADTGIGPDFLDRFGQVVEEAVGHPGQGVPQRDRDVDRGGPLQAVQAPAAVAHVLHDLVDVEAVVGGERGHPQRVAEHVQAGYGRHAVADSRPGLQDSPRRVEVALFADRHEGRPAGCAQPARPAAGEGGRVVEAARPVGRCEVLESPECPAPW